MRHFSILTIGPSFKLNARAIASLDLDIDLAVDIAYKVENTKVFFPPQRGKKSGGIAMPENSRKRLFTQGNRMVVVDYRDSSRCQLYNFL